ncbi:transcription elongation protein SprT [Riemerella anatipestifer]|uniref:SprT-like domain-containing protein n=1 Tax=Riemerella anatipestifer TaxID=34085 RepID=UPI0028610FED|nr:SprT-like domain-containing protein [Riemerella anatipestifer]MDR7845755.1 transcription elongation protein SprT [Riemerella anatipestifer]MDY3488349.1 transcription elongation protein SprT [Riemerella anatipestifer]
MSKERLVDFLPLGAFSYVEKWCNGYSVFIKITKDRVSKLGDYKKLKNKGHQITINGGLEKPLFFFVLTHEIAHLIAFEKYKKIAPHGKEWKQTFRELILESLEIYDVDFQKILLKFSKNPKASFNASRDLEMYFKKENRDGALFMENLDEGQIFTFRNAKFRMIEKKKKRYLCTHLDTGRQYLFSPFAEILID